MSSADARAVENPISAIFDLAEDVNEEAPKFKKLVTYATVFIGFWLFIDLILILAFIASNFLISIFLIILFVLGVITLSLLRKMNDFFRYYTQRHRVIMSVRNDDPVILVPEGKDAASRLITFLLSRNPGLRESYSLGRASEPQILRGRTGTFYQFDGYIHRSSGTFWRSLGVGYPGYQLFIKCFDSAPTVEDLMALKRGVEDVVLSNSIPPSRVIALWHRGEDEEISEGAYEALITQVVTLKKGSKTFACSLELVVENDDRTYEFVPYVVDATYLSTSRAQ